MRKDSVKDANAEYVMRLRVAENATDEEIQNALYQLFNSSPQGRQSNQGPQGQTNSVEEQTSPSIMSTTAISKIQLDNTKKNSLHSFL